MMISKILASLKTQSADNHSYFNLWAQIIKCEIYYSVESYLLDGLITLNQILPEILSSNSQVLQLRFFKIYSKSVLKISNKAREFDAKDQKLIRETMSSQSSLIEKPSLSSGQNSQELEVFQTCCTNSAIHSLKKTLMLSLSTHNLPCMQESLYLLSMVYHNYPHSLSNHKLCRDFSSLIFLQVQRDL